MQVEQRQVGIVHVDHAAEDVANLVDVVLAVNPCRAVQRLRAQQLFVSGRPQILLAEETRIIRAELRASEQLHRRVFAILQHHALASVREGSREAGGHSGFMAEPFGQRIALLEVVVVHHIVRTNQHARLKHVVDVGKERIKVLASVAQRTLPLVHAAIAADGRHDRYHTAVVYQALAHGLVGKGAVGEHVPVVPDFAFTAEVE